MATRLIDLTPLAEWLQSQGKPGELAVVELSTGETIIRWPLENAGAAADLT